MILSLYGDILYFKKSFPKQQHLDLRYFDPTFVQNMALVQNKLISEDTCSLSVTSLNKCTFTQMRDIGSLWSSCLVI